MGLTSIICSILLLAVCADLTSGQGYVGRTRGGGRPAIPVNPGNPGYPSWCGPVCSIHCPYGLQVDSRGCPTCQCKPGPIIDPFPQPTPFNRCPEGTVMEQPRRVCSTWRSTCGINAVCGTGPVSQTGYCCIYKRTNPNVHCPVDTSITPCFTRMDYCSATVPCPSGYKCCPRNCGNRCVPAQGELYRPRGRETRLA